MFSGGQIKISALEELSFYLKKAGLREDEIDILLARFLDEEAKEYVEINNEIIRKQNEGYNNISS